MAFQADAGAWATMSLGVGSLAGGAAPVSIAAAVTSNIARINSSPSGAV
jgi:hypothetical protein